MSASQTHVPSDDDCDVATSRAPSATLDDRRRPTSDAIDRGSAQASSLVFTKPDGNHSWPTRTGQVNSR